MATHPEGIPLTYPMEFQNQSWFDSIVFGVVTYSVLGLVKEDGF